MTLLECIFWFSLFGVFQTYIFYPGILLLWNKKQKQKLNIISQHPTVAIVFAAYNEERVIGDKLESILHCGYPHEQLEVLIGSDCSTDKTDEIILSYAEKFPFIKLFRMEQRTGKAGIINFLYRQTKAEFVLGTDANIFFTPGMISTLLAEFDDQTDIVGGNIQYRNPSNQGISKEETTYLNLENKLKTAESNLWGAVMGVEGGCYLIRKDAFREIPPLTFMEDFYITLTVLKNSRKAKFAPMAICTEDVSVFQNEEFKRKIRISIGNYQNLKRFWSLIFTRPFPVGYAFLSHKILRWLTPHLLLTLAITNIFLFDKHSLYQIALFGQIGLLLSLIFDRILPSGDGIVRSTIRAVGHFYSMNTALFIGFIRYIKGIQTNVWQPTQRAQQEA